MYRIMHYSVVIATGRKPVDFYEKTNYFSFYIYFVVEKVNEKRSNGVTVNYFYFFAFSLFEDLWNMSFTPTRRIYH